MKYEIEAGGQKFTIELQCENTHGVATINDGAVEFEVSEPEPGVYTFLLGNQVVEVRTVGNPTQPSFEAIFRGQRVRLQVIDPKRRRRGVITLTGKIELIATMPGRVVRCLCAPGESVTEGQGVIVLEAMKMQNEVRSAKSGIVAEIRVKPNQTVNAGQVLAVID
jgi:biotin carboxyl carrier protein